MMKQYTLKDLELPDDEPMVIIRSSMLWICDGDKYAAAALNMYVHWTRWLMKHRPVAQEINKMLHNQGKSASQDTSLILYRKQVDLIKDLLGFCNEKRLRQANAFLVEKRLLSINDTPRNIADHILKYELQIGTFKECMEEWRKHREETGQSENDELVEVALGEELDGTDNSPLRNGQFTASERTIVGSRNGQLSARNGQFTASTPALNDELERAEGGENSPHRYITRDDKREENSPNVSQSATFAPDGAALSSLYGKLTEEEKQAFKKALNLKEVKVSSPKKAATEEKPAPASLTTEEERRWRYWQKYINARRGGPLRLGGLVVNEQECLKKLVQEFPDEQIEAIDKYLGTEHWKYKKNPCEIGGKALLDESRPTWQLIKDRVQPMPVLNGVGATSKPRTNGVPTHAEMGAKNPFKGIPGKEQEWERTHRQSKTTPVASAK